MKHRWPFYLTLATCGLISSAALADAAPANTVKTSWDRSFYMNEPKARLQISSAVEGSAGALLRVELKALGGANVLQSRDLKLDARREGAVEFDLKNIKDGDYYVSISGGQGSALAATNASLKKLAYKAGAVQYTDEGVLLRDSAPIFPVGMYTTFVPMPPLSSSRGTARPNLTPRFWSGRTWRRVSRK